MSTRANCLLRRADRRSNAWRPGGSARAHVSAQYRWGPEFDAGDVLLIFAMALIEAEADNQQESASLLLAVMRCLRQERRRCSCSTIAISRLVVGPAHPARLTSHVWLSGYPHGQ